MVAAHQSAPRIRSDARGLSLGLAPAAGPERVRRWLQTAASVPGFIGFAVGRTCFWAAIVDYLAKRVSPDAAATQIAQNFEEWYSVFNAGRQART